MISLKSNNEKCDMKNQFFLKKYFQWKMIFPKNYFFLSQTQTKLNFYSDIVEIKQTSFSTITKKDVCNEIFLLYQILLHKKCSRKKNHFSTLNNNLHT